MEHEGKLSKGEQAAIDRKADAVLGKPKSGVTTLKKEGHMAEKKKEHKGRAHHHEMAEKHKRLAEHHKKMHKHHMKMGEDVPASNVTMPRGGDKEPMRGKVGAKGTSTVKGKGDKKASGKASIKAAPTKKYGANGVGGEWGTASREGV